MTDDKYGQSKAVDVLNFRALNAKRDYVRDLVNRDDGEALSLLVECLCDESGYLRDLAEVALPKLGDRGANAVLPLLESGLWFTRVSSVRVLGRMGFKAAVPALLRLTEDANRTVADAAREALVAIGHQGGSARIAHAIYRLPPDARRRLLDELIVRDRSLADRIDRLTRSEELMNVSDGAQLSDDSTAVRATEEGVEWEVLTGPPRTDAPPGSQGEGRGGR